MAMPERPVLGRRAALLVGAGGLAALVAACRGATPTSAPSPTPGAASSSAGSDPTTLVPTPQSSTAPETGDRIRLRMALDKTEAMLAGLLALRVRAGTQPLVDLHTTHRATLLDLLGEAAAPLPSPVGPPLTRAEVPLRESGLQAELVSASLAAEDGLVARLLASMSAGVAQRLVLLPPAPPRRRPGREPTPSGTVT